MTLFVGSQSFISLPSFMFVSAAVSELRELNQKKKKKKEKNSEINTGFVSLGLGITCILHHCTMCTSCHDLVFPCFYAIPILSDHLPTSFSLAVSPVCVVPSSSNVVSDYSPSTSPMCNWSKAEQCNIDEYWDLISNSLPCLPPDFEYCCAPDCSKHNDTLGSYSLEFIVNSACLSIPCHSRPSGHTLAGWNHGPKQLRSQATFWHRVWVEAGCPSITD